MMQNNRGITMASMASLTRAISGLHASQTGLYVTGHNLTNVNTPGYVRQQALQNDSFYSNIGINGIQSFL